VSLLGRVAQGQGGAEVAGAGGVFGDAAAVVGKDGEVDGGGLRALFEGGDGGFEEGFVEVGELVFGVGGEVGGGLGWVVGEVAWVVLVWLGSGVFCLKLDVRREGLRWGCLPDALGRELAVLLLPVSEAFLVFVEHLTVLFQLVAHLDLDGADLVQLGGLLVEFGLENGQFFFSGLQRLRIG